MLTNIVEEWRWIKDYEGLYQISNYGRLKSFLSDKENGQIRSNVNKNGWYFTVNLCSHNGRNKKTVRIHRLVYETFVGDIPKGFHIHHIDGNRQNNRIDNLELVHPSDHASKSINIHDNVSGMTNYNIFTKSKRVCQYTKDGLFLAEYVNCAVAGEITGICSRNIHRVASREPYGKNHLIRSQAGGFIWRFTEEVNKANVIEV